MRVSVPGLAELRPEAEVVGPAGPTGEEAEKADESSQFWIRVKSGSGGRENRTCLLEARGTCSISYSRN